MAPPDPLSDLIARLEKATRADEQLDAEIYELVTHRPAIGTADASWLPQYTSDLNAALSLVPEGFSIDAYIRPRKIGTLMRIGTSYEGAHLFPAIALCIAALKARTP